MPPASAALERGFFARDARVVARALIGTTLVVTGEDGVLRSGRIVETEAYCGPDDAACHARFGVTKRTWSLFLGPGHAYVFFIYGMHECFNVTCLREGSGHAVLVRAIEPGEGTAGRRGDGPGRLTRALGIGRQHDGLDVTGGGSGIAAENRRVPGPVRLLARGRPLRPTIEVSARVGVGYAGAMADHPWRFFELGSGSVSRPPAAAIGQGRPRSR